MIDEEYSELEEIPDNQLFKSKFFNRFTKYEVEIRRTYLKDPNEGGFQTNQRYYITFGKKAIILPTTKNISSKTGTSENTKANGTRLSLSNFVVYSTYIFLNNAGERKYTDLLYINSIPHRAVIEQRYNIVIPHIEYQIEGYIEDVKLILDEQAQAKIENQKNIKNINLKSYKKF